MHLHVFADEEVTTRPWMGRLDVLLQTDCTGTGWKNLSWCSTATQQVELEKRSTRPITWRLTGLTSVPQRCSRRLSASVDFPARVGPEIPITNGRLPLDALPASAAVPRPPPWPSRPIFAMHGHRLEHHAPTGRTAQPPSPGGCGHNPPPRPRQPPWPSRPPWPSTP